MIKILCGFCGMPAEAVSDVEKGDQLVCRCCGQAEEAGDAVQVVGKYLVREAALSFEAHSDPRQMPRLYRGGLEPPEHFRWIGKIPD